MKGKYQTRRGGGEWVFRLSTSVNGSTRAIVPTPQQSFAKGPRSVERLFLLRQTDSGNWIASLWPEVDNPWINKTTPTIGDIVEGSITGFNKQGSIAFADFEHLGKLFNGIIYPDHLPDFIDTYSVSSCLEAGDKISATILRIDQESLQFSLGFREWYLDLQDEWRRYASTVHLQNTSRFQKSTQIDTKIDFSFASESDTEILLIDDDEELCQSVQSYFASQNVPVSVSTQSSPKGIQESVYSNIRKNPKFIITDFQLSDDPRIANEIRATVEAYKERSPNVRVAVLSGNEYEAESYANRNGFRYFPKPTPLWKIGEWFTTSRDVESNAEKLQTVRSTHNFFAVEGQHKKIIAEAIELLEKICNRFDFWAALWVLRSPAASYEVRASTRNLEPFLDRSLVSQFKHSLVEDYTTGTTISAFSIGENDPLRKALPKKIRFGVAVPINYEKRYPRCIILLSETEATQQAQEYVRDRLDHFSLLVRGISQAEVIDEIAASAQQGRIAFATLHEIRTELQKISNAAYSRRSDSERLQRIQEHLVEAEKLTSGELTRFKAGESEKLTIREIITRTSSKMQLYLDDKSRTFGPRILIDLDERTSKIKMPFSVALERTLVNLIDNSADFLATSNTKYIWITSRYEERCDKYPVRITVRDTGPGISYNDLESVFSPRKSGRTELSTGLGLFISRELIEMLGGQILAKHRSRWSGAEFEIKLPELVG